MKRILIIGLLSLSLIVPCDAEQRVVADIEFAEVDGQVLKLDLYLPEPVNEAPLVVWIHGGGWRSGNKNNCKVKWLTEHGFAVASISYRLTDVAIFPAQIQDCKAAVRWLRANRSKYGYTTHKVGVAGASAGGMLAALLGTSGDVEELEGDVGCNLDHSSRVDAVIDFYGPVDFMLRSRTQPELANNPESIVGRLFGGGVDQKTELAKLASPVHHVTKDDPPLLIFQGARDRLVRPDQSERIRDVYKEAGLPVELVMLPDARHGGKGFFSDENRKNMVRFLKEHLMPRP